MGLWTAMRRRLGLGPSRAELRAESAMWQARSARAEAELRNAHARAKAAEKALRLKTHDDAMWQARYERAKAQRDRVEAELGKAHARLRRIRNDLHGQLVEPARVDGCAKIRFHEDTDAARFAAKLAATTGEELEAYVAYQCRICPRSPVTVSRFWHVGHREPGAAGLAKEARLLQISQRRAAAGREGRLLSQRVDPAVLARLRSTRQQSPPAGQDQTS